MGDWQGRWIILCFVTVFFFIFIDMSFEATMIGFVIPSQTISSVRSVQLVLNQALLKHALPNALAHFKKSLAEDDKKFTASKYLHVSHYLARHLKYLHESSMILSYVDPLPYVDYHAVESKTTKYSYSSYGRRGGDSRRVGPMITSNATATNNDYKGDRTILANISSKFNFAYFLVRIGTLPILFQRIVICLPIPMMSSLFGVVAMMIINVDPKVWIVMIFMLFGIICWVGFGLSHDIGHICSQFTTNVLHYSDQFKQHLNGAIIKAAKMNILKEKGGQSVVELGTDAHDHVSEKNQVSEETLHQIRLDAEMKLKSKEFSLMNTHHMHHRRLKERLKYRRMGMDLR